MQQERVRVGIVIGELTYGGAERQVVELACGLRTHTAFEPVVICYTKDVHPFGDSVESFGLRLVYPDRRLGRGLETALWIRLALKRERCALAYAMLSPTNVYCALACAGSRTKFVGSIRGVPELAGLLRRGVRWAYGRADALIANSRSGVDWAADAYEVSCDRVCVVPNAVSPIARDLVARVRLRRELNIADDAIVVGTVANLKPQKEPGFFLKVAHDVLADEGELAASPGKHVEFVWVGDGPLGGAIAEQLRHLGSRISSRIRFVGAKRDVEAWFSLFDVFVLTSAWEGLPGALMEAMSAGLPCLATDVPGTRDLVVHEKNALLAPFECGAFVRELQRLLSSQALQTRLGERARREMQDDYSREKLAQRTAKVFGSVLENRGKK